MPKRPGATASLAGAPGNLDATVPIAAFELLPAGIAVLDLQGRVQWSNESLQHLTGRKPGELLGRSVADFVPPVDLPGGTRWTDALLADGPAQPVRGEAWYVRPDGSSVYLVADLVVVRDAAGTDPVRAHHGARSHRHPGGRGRAAGHQRRARLHRRERAARHLRHRPRRARPALEPAGGADVRVAARGGPRAPGPVRVHRSVVDGRSHAVSRTGRSRSGTSRWRTATAGPSTSACGPRCCTDRPARRPACCPRSPTSPSGSRPRPSSIASEHRFRALVQNITDTVSIVDAEGRILFTSGQTEPVLGHSVSFGNDRNVFDVCHPDDVDRFRALLEDVAIHPGQQSTAELRLRHADGQWEVISVTAVNLLHDPDIDGIVMTSTNVTESRRSSSLLRSQARVLELIARSAPLDETLHRHLGDGHRPRERRRGRRVPGRGRAAGPTRWTTPARGGAPAPRRPHGRRSPRRRRGAPHRCAGHRARHQHRSPGGADARRPRGGRAPVHLVAAGARHARRSPAARHDRGVPLGTGRARRARAGHGRRGGAAARDRARALRGREPPGPPGRARRADRPAQPHPGARPARARARAGAASSRRRSRSSSSTSTGSRSSTTASATGPATSSSSASPNGCAPSCGPTTRSPASAATSS